ncbi:MAG TPA: MBL fold metallo-hydrolase [Candidatus Limnocylindrales bacterium]|nr:MBL fold metallo-hydrolase [Candidatus Limnocylindrales bacterium]
MRCAPEGISLQVLGSGGPRAGTDRASASYLVWMEGRARVMIDAGGGAFVRFGEAGASLADLRFLGLSHFHPDHVSDLSALLWLSDTMRGEPLPIAGPSGNDAFPSLDQLLGRLFDSEEGAFRVLSGTLGGPGRGVRLEPTTVDVADHAPVTLLAATSLTVRALSVPHTNSPALAYRIDAEGTSLVFGGDQTGEDARFVDFARDADVLVMHMAIGPSATGPVLDIHATPARVGEVARVAGVERLVLSHLVDEQTELEAGVAEVRQQYRGPVDVARDLDCFRAD